MSLAVEGTPLGPMGMSQALLIFFETMQSVAKVRAEQSGLLWVSASIDNFTQAFGEMDTETLGLDDYMFEAEDPVSAAAMHMLEMEMYYIAYAHREYLSERTRDSLQAVAENFSDVGFANPLSDKSMEDIETVKGSIEKLLDKLPGWAKKMMEVLMEALKLTRGAF